MLYSCGAGWGVLDPLKATQSTQSGEIDPLSVLQLEIVTYVANNIFDVFKLTRKCTLRERSLQF